MVRVSASGLAIDMVLLLSSLCSNQVTACTRPPRHISAIEMPSSKLLKDALWPRKNVGISTAMCQHVKEITSQKRVGIRRREIKYSRLVVNTDT
jgi:hypothetical protein